jgi:hypothetical protein
MEMTFLKKKKEGKGFFLVKKDGKIEDIQSLYPTQAAKLLFAKIKELKHFKFVDGDKWKDFVLFNSVDDETNTYQQDTIMNHIRQRLYPK